MIGLALAILGRLPRRAWYVLSAVVVVSLAVAWIYHSGFRSGANKNQLQEVRKVLAAKVSEGKVVEKKRVLAGQAAASSHSRSDLSRPKATKAIGVILEQRQLGQIPKALDQPIQDLVTHTDNLERENGDLRGLVFVDTMAIKNLTERLALQDKERELTPKAPWCSTKCGVAIGVTATTVIILVIKAVTK